MKIRAYSRNSLIRTTKGQSKVSVSEMCPYKRGHYDDVTLMTPLTVLSVRWQPCSVAKPQHANPARRIEKRRPEICLRFAGQLNPGLKLHLGLLIHSTKTLSFSSIQHCALQLRTYSRRQITVLTKLRGRDLAPFVRIRESPYYRGVFLKEIYEKFIGTLETVRNIMVSVLERCPYREVRL